MPESDVSEIKSLVISGRADLLKGRIENEWFDSKGQPYRIETDYGKRELAKDISSFGNRSGGLILIGARTQPSATHWGDEIVEIRPLPKNLVNEVQYRDIIKEWLYPEPENIVISWHEVQSSGNGIWLIDIPPQPEEKLPFLIRRTIDEKKNVEILFGYAKRVKDNSQPFARTNSLTYAVWYGLFEYSKPTL